MMKSNKTYISDLMNLITNKYRYSTLRALSIIFFCSAICMSCENYHKFYAVTLPKFENSMLKDAKNISEEQAMELEGIYTISEGSDFWGEKIVLKIIKNKLSIFGEKYGIYAVLELGEKEDKLIMEGFWKKATKGDIGLMRFIVDKNALLNKEKINIQLLSASYWEETEENTLNLTFQSFLKPENERPNTIILAHRAGGRTSDRMSVSENSLQMIRYTENMGTQGIEIDVRLTKDGVPIIYHDTDVNIRLIQNSPLMGPIKDYTYEQLSTSVRLYHGEKIPSLEEALTVVLNETNLRFVWLDTKAPEVIAKARPIQKRILEQAALQGRDLQILIGLPTQDIINTFLTIPDFKEIPSICETTNSANASNTNARVWAYRWTMGILPDIKNMELQDRDVFVWTVDLPDIMQDFLNSGHYQGILTNYPSLLAYYYYTR